MQLTIAQNSETSHWISPSRLGMLQHTGCLDSTARITKKDWGGPSCTGIAPIETGTPP